MEKENGTDTTRGEEIKGVEFGLEKLSSVSISPHQKEAFYFPWKETKRTAGTIVVARTPGDVLAAARALCQGKQRHNLQQHLQLAQQPSLLIN